MKLEHKFYKTVLQVEILSEDAPVGDDVNLQEIYYGVTKGEWSGIVNVIFQEELTPEQMASALMEQGSDSEFFQLHTSFQEKMNYNTRKDK